MEQVFSIAYDQNSDTLICIVTDPGQARDAAATWDRQAGIHQIIPVSNEVAVIIDQTGRLIGLRATQALSSNARLFATGFGMVQFPLPEGQ